MSDVDLLYSDVEDELRASVRGLLADRCPPSAVVPVYDGDRSLVRPLWQALAGDLGLAGLLVPEERGGAGAAAPEGAVVLEELGRAAAPVPFLTSSVVAATVLLGTESGGPRGQPGDPVGRGRPHGCPGPPAVDPSRRRRPGRREA